MTVHQLSVYIENKSGALVSVLRLLKQENIQLIASTIADTVDYGIFRIICSQPEQAYKVLRDAGVAVSLCEVFAGWCNVPMLYGSCIEAALLRAVLRRPGPACPGGFDRRSCQGCIRLRFYAAVRVPPPARNGSGSYVVAVKPLAPSSALIACPAAPAAVQTCRVILGNIPAAIGWIHNRQVKE